MLKRDLVEQLAERQGVTKLKSREIIDDFLDLIEKGLLEHKQVKISGFGTVEAVQRKPREAKNPQTGKPMKIEPGYRIRFKASRKVRELLDGE